MNFKICTSSQHSLNNDRTQVNNNEHRRSRIGKALRSKKRVVINVSGEIFETYERTLSRFPSTLLGDSKKLDQFYCLNRDQYLFDRLRICFGPILFFFQSNGILSCPSGIPVELFEQECRFYGIPEHHIYAMKVKEGIIPESKFKPYDYNVNTTEVCSQQQLLWQILEIPESSLTARLFSLFSLSVIFLSTIATCITTVTQFDFLPWSTIEYFLNTWFLIELILRFLASPDKYKFISSKMNWIDTFAVVPYFLLFLCIGEQGFVKLRFLRLLQTVRVIRLIRLSKQSQRLQMVTEITRTSLEDFGMLISCLGILLIFSSSILYYVESYDHLATGFTSIPASLWWAIATITTVGYGDVIPVTLFGKLLSVGFMALGALTVSLPVTSVVTRFSDLYMKNIDPERFGVPLGSM